MKYVVMFRGINVGGKHVVKMEELRRLLERLGFLHVKTYIQSGNAIFESDFEEKKILDLIHRSFVEQFGFESKIILRDMNQMERIITKLPFSEKEIESANAADQKVEHLYVYFFQNSYSREDLGDKIHSYDGMDQMKGEEKEIYLLSYQSIRTSKLVMRASKVLESATARNWKSVRKLYEMMCTM